MFDIPFLYGGAWSDADDKAAADVIVLTRKLSEKLYGDANPVGKRLRYNGFDFLITGVMDSWDPIPRFYRVVGKGAFSTEDEFYLPFSSAVRHEWSNSGNTNCTSNFGAGYQNFLASECTWLQFWFELRSAGDRADLQNYLDAYAAEQRKLGRLKRNGPNKLYDLMEWMDYLKIIGNDNKLSAWLAFGFLVLCLVNTIGLLLAKFSVRAAEVGMRRALGASRKRNLPPVPGRDGGRRPGRRHSRPAARIRRAGTDRDAVQGPDGRGPYGLDHADRDLPDGRRLRDHGRPAAHLARLPGHAGHPT
jgi:putative ABC transport system permease protein